MDESAARERTVNEPVFVRYRRLFSQCWRHVINPDVHADMEVIDEPLLSLFRESPCEICGKRPPSEPHHIASKGIGGGNRQDVRSNLVALCRRHHQEFHDGNLRRDVLKAIVQYRGDA